MHEVGGSSPPAPTILFLQAGLVPGDKGGNRKKGLAVFCWSMGPKELSCESVSRAVELLNIIEKDDYARK